MTHAVFMHRSDSIYQDVPAKHYQFPAQYLTRAQPTVGDWIVYLEPRKVRDTRGYFAVAFVDDIVPDPIFPRMWRALIAPGRYLEFPTPVPFNTNGGVVERGLLNDEGNISGRAQAAIRPLSPRDFATIVDLGLAEADHVLPRSDAIAGDGEGFDEASEPFIFDGPVERARQLVSRTYRDGVFRRLVLAAYEERCALTGLRLINGGGRAEVEAAHIMPVSNGGPDAVQNGLALCGTAHWMFDRGLLTLDDDLTIRISRQVNDPDAIGHLLLPERRARLPVRAASRPHPDFLRWHRETCFKQ